MTTIAATIRQALTEGKTTSEVLDAVKATFPNANTSPACVAYYRSKMKKGETAPKKKEVAKAVESGHGYTVRKLKSFIGMEGYGFNADLYRDGKKVAFVIDDASGGCLDIQWVGGHKSEEAAKLREYVKSLPTFKLNGVEANVEVDEDLFIGELVNDAFLVKDLRSKMKGKVLFIIPSSGDMYTVKHAQGDLLKAIAAMQEKHGKDILVLNAVTDDKELVSIARKFVK